MNELIFKYREHLNEYSVEENGFCYYMPYSYILQLQDYLKISCAENKSPIECWYISLKDIERKVVCKKSKDEEKLSSIW